MNRPTLQALADERLGDAALLMATSRWPAAYYLTGYAVECGLKSCILVYIDTTRAIFRDAKYADRGFFSHNFDYLTRLAGLDDDRNQRAAADATFRGYPAVVKDWNEQSRYAHKSEAQARALLEAITDPTSGVLPWIRTHW